MNEPQIVSSENQAKKLFYMHLIAEYFDRGDIELSESN